MIAWLQHEDRKPVYEGFRSGAYNMAWFMVAMIAWYIATNTGQGVEHWLREVGSEGWVRGHFILALAFIVTIVT